jgi:hypothetical protein
MCSNVLRGSGWPVSCRGTLAVAIVATAALGENLRFAIRAALGFLRPLHDTGPPEPDHQPHVASGRARGNEAARFASNETISAIG